MKNGRDFSIISRDGGDEVKINIKTISDRTGFSQATVSNVLNRKKGVKASTAEEILRVAREVGYISSESGVEDIRLVMYKKSGEILTETPLINALLEGVESEAKRNGLSTIISNLSEGEPDFESKLSGILSLQNSGILLLATEMEWEDMRQFEGLRNRLVVVDAWFREGNFDTVLMNNTDSFYSLVEYLHANGHRRIGLVESSTEIRNFRYRKRGFFNAMQDFGLPCEEPVRVGPTMVDAYKDMKAYLETGPALPTAFCAINDIVAFGVMKALKECKYRIPEDVSVVGFDNMPFCDITSPPLTTINVQKREMGEAAVRRVLEKMENRADSPMKLQLLTSFCERSSVRKLI